MKDLTPTEIMSAVLAVASAIVLISNAAEKIVKAVKAAKAPEQRQNDEIADIKARLEKVEREMLLDEKQLKDARECNHVITKGVLALLDHGINGNNIDQMKDARHDVEKYLINH
jgi:uncharacterized protein with PhoU and TrkA domain